MKLSRECLVTKYLNDTNDDLHKVDNLSPKEFSLGMICATLITISISLAQIVDMMGEERCHRKQDMNMNL